MIVSLPTSGALSWLRLWAVLMALLSSAMTHEIPTLASSSLALLVFLSSTPLA